MKRQVEDIAVTRVQQEGYGQGCDICRRGRFKQVETTEVDGTGDDITAITHAKRSRAEKAQYLRVLRAQSNEAVPSRIPPASSASEQQYPKQALFLIA